MIRLDRTGRQTLAHLDDKGNTIVYRSSIPIARDLMCPERDCAMAGKKRRKPRPQSKPSFALRIPQPPTADVLVYTEYDITDEPLDNRDIKKLPSQVQARIDDLYELAQRDPTQAIPELERLV